jgi:hypothetical protein
MFQRIIVIIALVLMVGVVVFIFGRGLLQDATPATEPVGSASGEAQSNSANLTVEQVYARDMEPVLTQFKAWRSGPVAERTETLATKIEGSGPLANLTYGNFLLLYLNAQAAGRSDLAMDWVVLETISPKLQPIYEMIVTESAAISAAMANITPPAELSDPQNRLLQCLNYENQRTQIIVDILAGNSSASVPERSSDPCTQIDADVEAIDGFINANMAP